MPIQLKGRHFLTLRDFSSDEIRYLLDLSHDLKKKKRAGTHGKLLSGKNIVLIFDKTSTRTRAAFETAAFDEGARVTYLTNSQMGKKESIEDTAKVLGRYYDGIQFRGFEHSTIEELAQHAGVPVWNGLTDQFHPTQVLADLMTLQEHCPKPLHQMKLVYIGDARNNTANSLMIGAAKVGVSYTSIAPRSLAPSPEVINLAKKIFEETGSKIEITESISEGVKGADAIYTDVWFSMGEEDKIAERIALLKPYQVTREVLQASGNSPVLFLHCLPSFHDTKTQIGREIFDLYGLAEMEVTDEVFRSPNSVVFDQAENRLHTIKAVMVATIGH